MIPSHFQLQYSEKQIADAVAVMGQKITQWSKEVWAESHTDVIAIPVLRGGIFFFADLVRKIQHSVEIVPIRTWAYDQTENNVTLPEIKINMEGVSAKGRVVLIIDDICDSGRTLAALSKALTEAGALQVKTAVLIHRTLDKDTFQPDYVGFEFSGSEWFVGYGMEDCERWRNLPASYVIKQSA